MKKFNEAPIAYIVFLFSLSLLFSGCGTILTSRKAELIRPASTNITQIVITNTVQREVWTTNRVEIPGGTNALGQVYAPEIKIQPVREIFGERVTYTNMLVTVAPAVWFTNISASPMLTGGVEAIGQVAPVPWGSLAAGGLTALLGVASGIYNWIGKRRAEKEAGVQEDLKDTALSAVDLTVKSVDQVRKVALQIPGYTTEIDKHVMDAVRVMQTLSGSDVKEVIEESVAKNTVPMIKATPGGLVV